MPKELPGFYYDAEKNRYFPYKGPIPGSSRKPPPVPPPSDPKQTDGSCQSTKIRKEVLLQARELYGDLISCRKEKLSFQSEYQKRHASQPIVWKYRGTKKMANIALAHVLADVTSSDGLVERDILLSGGVNGLLRLFLVGTTRQEIDPTQIYEADPVWPLNLDQISRQKQLLRQLGSSYGAATYMRSDVSCIKVLRKSSLLTDDTIAKHLMITTLGSDRAPGSVYLLDLSKPLDFDTGVPAGDGFNELAAFERTLWTVDCDPEGRSAAIGTNRGVELLNVETGVSSQVLRCKSDVMSVQLLNQSGKVILCGLRNGAIMTVDTRQKQIRKAHGSSRMMMSSSVCCLASLKLWDQYYLASAVDGSIKLYDHRLIHRGQQPIQSYEGNVNTHSRIELGVDPSEKFVMSGGEDCYLRLWDIKSGELLLKDKFMDSIPSAVCWPRNGCLRESIKDGQDYRSYWHDHRLGAWLGSDEGIFYMDWL